ncbi:MAG: ester cyclase [Chloroflexi bacterium]|nr:MAG: ester cyclase [Chloroflexota bacterium]
MATEKEERNKAIVREVNGRMVKRDMTVYDDHPGLSETRQFFPRLLQAFPDLAIRIETIIAEGDQVAVHAWYEGQGRAHGVQGDGQCAPVPGRVDGSPRERPHRSTQR